MKKTFLIGSVAALAALSACSLTGKEGAQKVPSATQSQSTSSTTTNSQTATKNQVTVTYTDEGFSPATVEVASGTEVVFVNNSTNPFWPASAPHPAHTDLEGFDAKAPVALGETYSFVFEKVGSWGFHNHLDSKKFGKVVVK